jgi:hypothetical protein
VEVLPASAPPTDTTPPAGNFLNPANGQTVSGTVPVNVNATDNVAVASVQLTLDGHALGPLLTAPPYAWSWDTTTASAGNHTLGAVIRDSSGNTGAATAIVVDVENPAPPMACFIIDAKSFVDGSNTVTTPPFTTALPGELLLAFVSADGSLRTTQTATVSGAGLTWTLVARANGQAGTAEIWTATAATPLSNVTVTSRLQKNGYHQSLSVIAMQGTDGLGASAFASRSSGAPQVSLTTTRANSLVFGVGIDWDQAIPRTLDVNQTLLHQWVDTATGTTFWVQNTSVQSGPAGSLVMLDDTAPTGDRWDFAAVEVIGAAE